MTISRKLFTNEELILTNLSVKNKSEIIKSLGKKALALGYIEEEFINNVLDREKDFPTGLEMALPIAIPHIREGCKKSFLSMASLKNPIAFKAMEDSDKEIMVELVFMFGITDPSDQLEILKKLVDVFQDKDALESLKKASTSEEVLEKLRWLMGGYVDIGTKEVPL